MRTRRASRALICAADHEIRSVVARRSGHRSRGLRARVLLDARVAQTMRRRATKIAHGAADAAERGETHERFKRRAHRVDERRPRGVLPQTREGARWVGIEQRPRVAMHGGEEARALADVHDDERKERAWKRLQRAGRGRERVLRELQATTQPPRVLDGEDAAPFGSRERIADVPVAEARPPARVAARKKGCEARHRALDGAALVGRERHLDVRATGPRARSAAPWRALGASTRERLRERGEIEQPVSDARELAPTREAKNERRPIPLARVTMGEPFVQYPQSSSHGPLNSRIRDARARPEKCSSRGTAIGAKRAAGSGLSRGGVRVIGA